MAKGAKNVQKMFWSNTSIHFLQIFEWFAPNKHIKQEIFVRFDKGVAPNKGVLEGKNSLNQ